MVNCTSEFEEGNVSNMSTHSNLTIGGLLPFTNYSCHVYALIDGNMGHPTANITSRTTEEGKYIDQYELFLTIYVAIAWS